MPSTALQANVIVTPRTNPGPKSGRAIVSPIALSVTRSSSPRNAGSSIRSSTPFCRKVSAYLAPNGPAAETRAITPL